MLGRLEELLSELGTAEDTSIALSAEGSDVDEGETVIRVTGSHQNKTKKTFIIKKAAATVGCRFDTDVFSTDRSDAIWVLPLCPKTLTNSLPLIDLWELHLLPQRSPQSLTHLPDYFGHRRSSQLVTGCQGLLADPCCQITEGHSQSLSIAHWHPWDAAWLIIGATRCSKPSNVAADKVFKVPFIIKYSHQQN